jgi:hypothetical protein
MMKKPEPVLVRCPYDKSKHVNLTYCPRKNCPVECEYRKK